MSLPRLRQLVIAARTLDVARQLQAVLGLGDGFDDPGVREFGLLNRVHAIGDQFLEVVVPVVDTAPAARFIARGGEGGYMAIFQTDDLAAVRTRADGAGIRRVWNIDLPDIAASHLHPADIGAAIVSVDEARPASSWRWGGPDWTGRSTPGRLMGAVITSPAPERLAARWGEALGAEARGTVVELADAALEFRQGTEERLDTFLVAVADLRLTALRAVASGLAVIDDTVRIGGAGIVLSSL